MKCPFTKSPEAGITTRGDYVWFRLGGGRSYAVSNSAIAMAKDPANAALVQKQSAALRSIIKNFRGPGFPMITTTGHSTYPLFRVDTK